MPRNLTITNKGEEKREKGWTCFDSTLRKLSPFGKLLCKIMINVKREQHKNWASPSTRKLKIPTV